MIPIAMLAFMGYDVLPQAAEEVNAPIRKMVFIIPVSIFFVAFMYIAVLVVTAGVVHWETIAKNTEHIPIMPSVFKALLPPVIRNGTGRRGPGGLWKAELQNKGPLCRHIVYRCTGGGGKLHTGAHSAF